MHIRRAELLWWYVGRSLAHSTVQSHEESTNILEAESAVEGRLARRAWLCDDARTRAANRRAGQAGAGVASQAKYPDASAEAWLTGQAPAGWCAGGVELAAASSRT